MRSAIAAGVFLAQALGRGDVKLAKAQAAALVWGVVAGAVFVVAVWLNLEALAALPGASGKALESTVHYLQITVPSPPFLIVGGIFALSGAIGPVIGQTFGARRMDRVRQADRHGLPFCAIFTLAMTAILFDLRGPIIALFEAGGGDTQSSGAVMRSAGAGDGTGATGDRHVYGVKSRRTYIAG